MKYIDSTANLRVIVDKLMIYIHQLKMNGLDTTNAEECLNFELQRLYVYDTEQKALFERFAKNNGRAI
jgi:hypothetical protein